MLESEEPGTPDLESLPKTHLKNVVHCTLHTVHCTTHNTDSVSPLAAVQFFMTFFLLIPCICKYYTLFLGANKFEEEKKGGEITGSSLFEEGG